MYVSMSDSFLMNFSFFHDHLTIRGEREKHFLDDDMTQIFFFSAGK